MSVWNRTDWYAPTRLHAQTTHWSPKQDAIRGRMRADALRYLPGNVTVTSVAGTFWNAQRESVATGFHMAPQPGSDALSPAFFQSHVIGAPPEAALQDATATLVLEVRR